MSDDSTTMAAAVAAALRSAGTDMVFGVPGGGSNLDVVGAVEATGGRFVLTHNETAAMIMASAAAEVTGRPSAAVVTRGPGAASATNGAAHALLDRQPVVLITDCVTVADRDRVSHQRLDQPRLLGAVTKTSLTLGPHDAGSVAAAAVTLACSGRPGPVHLDMDPTAVATSSLAGPPSLPESRHADPTVASAIPGSPPGLERRPPDPTALEAARAALRHARRPVVVAGIGAVALPRNRRSEATAALRRFVGPAAVPTLTTYKARGIVADSAPAAAGIATGATIEAPVLADADLIIGVGLDPVELIPGPWPYTAPMVLLGGWAIDDSTFFGERVVAEVVGDPVSILDQLAPDLTFGGDPSAAAQHSQAARARVLAAVPPSAPQGLLPQQLVTIAREVAPPGTIATVDSGAHMLPAVPLWHVDEPGELLISSGLATMGFALPAAIAAALVRPGRHVVCFTGDGGIGMVLAELETLARLGLPVVVVVFNDAALSLIGIKQRAEGHGGEGAVRYAPIDFAAVGAATGLAAARVDDASAYRAALHEALDRQGPTLLDVTVDPRGYAAVLEAIRGNRAPSVD